MWRGLLLLLFGGMLWAQQQAPPTELSHVSGELDGVKWTHLSEPGSGGRGRFTVECLALPNGTHQRNWHISFDSETVSVFQLQHTRKPTEATYRYIKLSLEFVGYKPMKREWLEMPGHKGIWIYNRPGMHSANMEPVEYLLQFMLAVDSVKISGMPDEEPLQFATGPLVKAVAAEPLCR